jgi:hypothetical protein
MALIKPDPKELAADYLRAAEQVGGCMDGGCVILQPTGQHTNGGCRCTLKMDPIRERGVRKLLMMAQHLAKEVTHDPS